MKLKLLRLALAIATLLSCTGTLPAAEVTVVVPDLPLLQFALGKLQSSLRQRGDMLRLVSGPAADQAAMLNVTIDRVTAGGVGPEGFRLARMPNGLLIAGGSERGAMYGVLDVTEQIRRGTPWDKIEERSVKPQFEFRAIKFNLPCSSVLTADIHVAPIGNDTNLGTAASPFTSLEKARDAARQPKRSSVILAAGQVLPPGANERKGDSASHPNIIVFYTDDHGYADLGIQNVMKDVKTPHTDALARSGVVARHGYSTAPQCVPSRAGLLTGRFQARFGVESNNSQLDGSNRQTTIAARLQKAGYVTAQFGKWHLGPTAEITKHGFTHVFAQNGQAPFSANITLDGQDRPMGSLPPASYHLDACSQAAAALIERYRDKPFFLYIAYRAPHVPLDPPKKYLDRFPGEMPERRRKALAMISAVDDGVGLITDTLKKHGLTERTLIFYIGDNGAPLKIHKPDAPGGGPGWDGSLNDPLNGEKGMLAEGGMHVPFVIAWPGKIPAGQTYGHPVSALDVAATAAALADIKTQPGELDGVNLIPHLTGENKAPPHAFLAWRWNAQSAIREGNWKLLRGGAREYLYNLADDLEEKHNLATQMPEVASRLRAKLKTWCDELDPPGLANGRMAPTWEQYFDHYLEGKTVPAPDAKAKAKRKAAFQPKPEAKP